ncbi:MAG: cytochrome P450 [Actinomycetota bacterium]|nr:cytochrome P450 [Actinomycetota bacterium]
MNLLDRSFYARDPYPALADLRTNEPVYHDSETGLWALLRYDDIVAAEKRTDVFSSAHGSRPLNGPQPSMIDSDDPLHHRRRSLVDKGFRARNVLSVEPHVREIARELIDCVASLGACDLVGDLAASLPMIVIAEMLGVRKEDRALLQHWSDTMISGADGIANVTEDVLRSYADFTSYMDEIIEARRKEPRDDVISKLVHAEIDGERLSHEELIGEALLILIGGNETTRSAISGGLLALMQFPDQRRRLVNDPSLLHSAVEESLRWVTPVINMARTTTQDIGVRGTSIPIGDQVLLMYISANRDESIFDRADDFDITRNPNPHLAFGQGVHHCLGAALARLETAVMFEELLRRIPDMEPASDDFLQTPSSFVRGLPRLPVTFSPR